MQALYAYYQNKQADFELTFDYIEQALTPNPLSENPPSKDELQQRQKEAFDLFKKNAHAEKTDFTSAQFTAAKVAAFDATRLFSGKVNENKKKFEQLMLAEIDQLYQAFLYLLSTLTGLAHTGLSNYTEKKELSENHPMIKAMLDDKDSLLDRNLVIKALQASTTFNQECKKYKIMPELADLWEWHKLLKKDADYLAYLQLKNPDFEQDKEIVLHIIKNFLLKNELICAHLEERDMNWGENKEIVRTLLLKTVKNISAQNQEIELFQLSQNWTDDKEFFIDLFRKTTEEAPTYDQYIQTHIKNWEEKRLALTDKILMRMAIAEFIHFYSIPVKVSINEYLELSKKYSSPKSKIFLNGVLDSISEDLSAKGLIYKSGRGLLDNK